MKILIAIVLSVVALCILGCSRTDKPTSRDVKQASATARDFFFYSCVHEYMKANGIKNFDGSVGYAVEHSKLSADELTRLHESAKASARGMPAPDYEDEEHGLGPVLVLCEREAGKY